MKQLILTTVLALCIMTGIAQTSSVREKTEAYINNYKDIAIREMLRTGVPASIKLAQGILESQFGESDLARSSNNHFGIKCKTEWTGEKIFHDDDAKGECFRVYNSVEESYRDHSDFLKTRSHYSFLFQLDPTDHTGWAYGLKRAGYATSKTYPEKLLKVIDDYQLQQYTIQGIAMRNNPSGTGQSNNTISSTLPNETTNKTVTVPAKEKETPPVGTAEPVVQQTANATNTTTETAATKPTVLVEKEEPAATEKVTDTPVVPNKPSPYPEGVFTINHTKAIYAREGTSLLALASLHDISLSKLFEFNDISEMDILDTDRLLFIERKQKKGAADTHEVVTGETLHDVCQKEGIRLDNLLEYNKLKKDSKLTAGQKLYLRSPAEIEKASNKARNKSTK
jgi:hypothetical protein